MSCLKCNSDLEINLNLNTPSTSSVSMSSLDLQSSIAKTIKDLVEVGEEINTYRALNSKKTDLILKDLFQGTISEKHKRLV